METRTEITTEEAQRIISQQENDDLIEFVFELGLSDYEGPKEEIKDILREKTEWSLIREDGKYYLDWKNNIMGFGTGFWGHDPIPLNNLKR